MLQQGSDNIKSYYYNIQTSNFETFAERVLCESYVPAWKRLFQTYCYFDAIDIYEIYEMLINR